MAPGSAGIDLILDLVDNGAADDPAISFHYEEIIPLQRFAGCFTGRIDVPLPDNRNDAGFLCVMKLVVQPLNSVQLFR